MGCHRLPCWPVPWSTQPHGQGPARGQGCLEQEGRLGCACRGAPQVQGPHCAWPDSVSRGAASRPPSPCALRRVPALPLGASGNILQEATPWPPTPSPAQAPARGPAKTQEGRWWAAALLRGPQWCRIPCSWVFLWPKSRLSSMIGGSHLPQRRKGSRLRDNGSLAAKGPGPLPPPPP